MSNSYYVMNKIDGEIFPLPKNHSGYGFSKKNIKKALQQLQDKFPKADLVVVQMIPKIVKI